MPRVSRTGMWIGGAFATTVALSALALAHFGAGTRGTDIALRLSARWAYCFFWPAYAGGALARAFGSAFRPLARRGRDLGLAFASAQTVHLCLVAWIYWISPKPPLPPPLAIFFAIAVGFMYLLALFSIPSLAARLPPLLWTTLRTVGMEYIALAFLRDFLQNPLELKANHVIEYAPFAIAGLAALLLRLIGYAQTVRQRLTAAPGIRRNGSSVLR